MALLWNSTEQQTIKAVSANNITRFFTQLATEVQAIELPKLLGHEFYNDLITNPSNYSDLINGTTYEYKDVTYTVHGLKYVLAYYWYARYIAESSMEDTFSGMVHKNFDDSQRVSSGTLKMQQLEARSIAEGYWYECRLMMTRFSTDYEYFYCNKRTFKFRTL